MSAALQRRASKTKPILLNYRRDAGHIGPVRLAGRIETDADILTFFGAQLGLKPLQKAARSLNGGRGRIRTRDILGVSEAL